MEEKRWGLVLSLDEGEAVAIKLPEGEVRVRYVHKSGRRGKLLLDAPRGYRIDRVPAPSTPAHPDFARGPRPGGTAA